MKNQLLFMFMLFAFISKAQQPVVFFPSGAKWHYNFAYSPYYGIPPVILNQTAEYVGDTLMDNEPVKIIRHPQFDMASFCNCTVTTTYIKQHGDTVFMNNACLPGWQILYNFATPVGGYWITNVAYLLHNITTPTETTFTVTVDSIKTISINNQNLKRLYTTIEIGGGFPFRPPYNEIFTERIGGTYLFSTTTGLGCGENGDITQSLTNLLCYQDNTLGLYQHTDKACNYTTYDVGIDKLNIENEALKIYPNPANEMLNVESPLSPKGGTIKIIDVLGKTVCNKQLVNQKTQINVSELQKGIYFIEIGNAVRKFVKE